MAKREEPATKGDLEDLATSFKEGIAGLVGGKGDKGDNAPPKKDDTGSEGDQGDDDESPLSFLFPKAWWGDRAS